MQDDVARDNWEHSRGQHSRKMIYQVRHELLGFLWADVSKEEFDKRVSGERRVVYQESWQ